MKCHQVEILISAYLDGEITASEWQQTEKHIDACSSCRQILEDFQFSTSLFQQKMQKAFPAKNLWPGLVSRIESTHKSSGLTRFSHWLRRLFETLIISPPAHIRAVQVGFAVVVLVILLTNRLQKPIDSQRLELSKKGQETSQAFSVSREETESEQNREQLIRTALAQQIENYFDQTGVLLMEIKNSEPEQEQLDLSSIRNTSQNLLEKTVFIKKDLQKTDLDDLKGTVENLELLLFDLANLKDTLEKSDIEMLKATILRQDILIKIEIFDAKSIELKEIILNNKVKEPGQKDRSSI